MGKVFWVFIGSFCALFILTFEFEYSLFPEAYLVFNIFFEKLVSFTGQFLFRLHTEFDPSISSDSIGLFVHLCNVFVLSVLVAFLSQFFGSKSYVNLRHYILLLLTYYVSLQLLIYGFDKLFKAQFFYPEPNILHTQLKDLSRDILYWSTMGMSRGYSIFLGSAEIITAACLVWKRTRLLGALLGLGIMTNVLAVNVGFDISVKVYSTFLFSCFVLILSPWYKHLWHFFFRELSTPPQEFEFSATKKNRFATPWFKTVIIFVMCMEALFPYLASQNWNDDTAPRPKFHGAYVMKSNELGFSKFYIHRAGYLILENESQQKKDFELHIDSANSQLITWDYRKKKELRWRYISHNNKLTGIAPVAESESLVECEYVN